MPGKQARYKIETQNKPCDKDKNCFVASVESVAQLFYITFLGTTKYRTLNCRICNPIIEHFLKRQLNASHLRPIDV